MKRLLVAVVGALTIGAVAVTTTSAPTTDAQQDQVCDQLTTGHLSGGATSVSFTAPDGFLVVTFCVKAGSFEQGDGPEYTNVDPAQQTVTITHSSGKAISHYSVLYKPEVPPSTTTTTTPGTTSSPPTTQPQCPNPPCVPGTNVQTTTTTSMPATTSTSTSLPTTSSSVASTTTTSPPSSTSTTVPNSSTPPTSSTSPASSSTTTTTLPETFTFGAALTVCVAEVPTIRIEFQNLFPDLAGQTGTLTMTDINGNVVSEQPLVYQPGTTVDLLYPGTTVNADGSIADVPGWILNTAGFWIRDPSDEFLRDGINLTFEVNPTAGPVLVEYPPESSTCANPPGPFPPTTTTPPAGALPPTQ